MIEVAPKAKEQLRIKAAAEAAASRGLPDWMEVDAKALKGTFKALPQRAELSSDDQREPHHRAVLEVTAVTDSRQDRLCRNRDF